MRGLSEPVMNAVIAILSLATLGWVILVLWAALSI
jgi:hypothetical protein